MAIKPKEAYELDDRQLKYIAEAEKTIDEKLNEQPEGVTLFMEFLSHSKKCHNLWWSNNRAAREKLKSIYTKAGWVVHFDKHHDIHILPKQKSEPIFRMIRGEKYEKERSRKLRKRLNTMQNVIDALPKLIILMIIILIIIWW